ncbi:glycosyltransferase family 4 protein [Ruania halotolerans]|uniref:glycosyltransferase family 4 protein n=1 Tax=Ruania halotolerans TaxID=2897773 RepID=UPI001E33AE40|nr:glycosyltransferase family 1 protein [Ruania halotolerans]UFU04949.1 glycosyltransferase family 1 protein [Ruania halotolerans]
MRVAVVTESFLPSLNGVTTSVLRVLDHLRAEGHEAVVVCPGPSPREYAGFPVHPVPSLDYRGFRAAVPSRRLTKTVLDFRPDILHAAAPFGIGAQALALGRRQGIGSVAVFQTDVARYTRSYGLSLTHHAAWRWIKYVHGLADITLAPSRSSLEDLAAAGVERTAWWGRGVDSTLYHPKWRTSPAGRALRERLSPDGAALIGYVGRLAPEKNVSELAPLAAMHGARLVVVGDGPDRPVLERTLRGTDAVLLGRLEGAELAAAYAAFDVFVHTGTSETFGQTLQEAMASGLPVVAPAVGGPLDLVEAGQTGFLVTPHDASALQGAVGSLVQDPGMRARMGEAGRRAILPRSWQALCDQLVQHYDSVAQPMTVR